MLPRSFGERPRLYFPSSIGRDATYGWGRAESRCTARGIPGGEPEPNTNTNPEAAGWGADNDDGDAGKFATYRDHRQSGAGGAADDL